MVFALLSIPLSLLCFYLAHLCWGRRYRRHAAILILFGAGFLVCAVGLGLLTWISVREYQSFATGSMG